MAQWYIHTFQIECCWVSECVKVGGAYIHCLTVSLCLDLMLTNGGMTIGTAPFLTVAAGLGLLGLGTFRYTPPPGVDPQYFAKTP